MGFKVAIDGPSGAGKSTLARAAAQQLGFIYVDTGALYRAIGLYTLENGIDCRDGEAVSAALSDIGIDIEFRDASQHVILNGEDVSEKIRMHEVSECTSVISTFEAVRAFLLETQRSLAESYNVIMDGRDIGTVVLPDAQLKIYLTASSEARARRRFDELVAKGQTVTYERILEDVISRDRRDMSRKLSPLKRAEDAVLVDTTELSFEDSLDRIATLVREAVK